jgi:NAD(P)-dependent dehydrogenase (short-subunit alcohol dehydrogenase family)
MTSLADQTVLVTGANRGMGREYVTQLLDRGVTKVYAAARDPRTIDVVDARVVPVRLDVTDATSVAEAASAASDVSVLINNAGIARGASVLDRDTSQLREEMEMNLFVVGVYVGLVDTDMGAFADSPKSDPADVVRQVLDGIESGADEVLADEMTLVVRAQLNKPIRERVS